MNAIDVKEIRVKLGLKQQEFADAIGISKSAVQKWESKVRFPDDLSLEKIHRLVQKHTSEVKDFNNNSIPGVIELPVTDSFELQYLENNNSNTFFKLDNGQYLMTMPLAEFNIQAGFLDHYQDIEYLKGLSKHSIIVDMPAKGRYVAFRVKGDSMDDGTSNAILQNSIVSTRELQRHLWNDKLRTKDFQYWVIYTTESRLPLLKEITDHDVERGVIKCHSLNDGPEYQDFELSLDTVQGLFYVVDVSRQLSKKTIY